LKPFDLATQILFEDNLENWRNSLNLPQTIPKSAENTANLSKPSSPVPSISSVSTSESRFSSDKILSTSNKTNMTTLSTILNETQNGIMLAEYYKKYEKFENEQRTLLINTCANFFHENDITMSIAASYKLEKEILETFPTEKLVSYLKFGTKNNTYVTK